MPEVSIIVPVYKVEPYLEKCVASILRQSVHDIEVILVDDGSPDKCPEICDRLAVTDLRIQVIHQQNKGLGGARNTGIEAATAPFLLFVDSDDTIHEKTAELTLAAAAQYAADIVIFDIACVNGDGTVTAVIKSPITKLSPLSVEEHPEILACTHSACNKLFSRTLFTDSGIRFPDHLWYEDLRTIPKLYTLARGICYLDAPPLYDYLTRDQSIMHSADPARVTRERMDSVEHVLAYFKDIGIAWKYKDELSWIAAFHGFFLPSREMIHYAPDFPIYVRQLRKWLDTHIVAPKRNPYYAMLTKKEKLMFSVFYRRCFLLMRLLIKLDNCKKR